MENSIKQEIENELEQFVQESGRDSGLSSTESPRYQDTNAKLTEVEHQLQELVSNSHKELQEAKQKLEELRLMRYEEQTAFKNEIEQLQDKVDEEENNSSFLEESLKSVQSQKEKETQRVAALVKEQVIGSQINMMQEQELVRLEMKLKEKEIEQFSVSKQLDHQRRVIIEKDRIRLKQQEEIHTLTESINQLEDRNSFYKHESEGNHERLRSSEKEIQSLKKRLFESKRELENLKSENTTSKLEMQQMKMSCNRLEECVRAEQELVGSLKEKLAYLQDRNLKQEESFHERELNFQQDLELASTSETKLAEKCEKIEHLYHETRRKKDEKDFEIKQYQEKIVTLQEQLQRITDQKYEADCNFTELQTVINQHITTSVNSPQSPKQGTMNMYHTITPEELNDYFETNSSRMSSLQFEVTDLTTQIRKEQDIMQDMNITIADVKLQLERTRENLNSTAQMKDSLEIQCQRSRETIRMQEHDVTRLTNEIHNLQNLLKESKSKVQQLESNITVTADETTHKEEAHKEEIRKLKGKIKALESNNQLLEATRKEIKEELLLENLKLQEKCDELEKENNNLKNEMQNLIDDNRNFAQRLIHLESYSDRLNSLVEQHQNDNSRLKEKLHNQTKHNRTISEEKQMEIVTLSQKVESMNRSLHEKDEKSEKLNRKLKNVKEDQKHTEGKMKELDTNNSELEKRIKLLTDNCTVGDRTIAVKNEEIKAMHKRFREQSKNIENLFARIEMLENEKKTLKSNLSQAENRLTLKENMILDLSEKNNETSRSYEELKSSVHKVELAGKQHEYKADNLRQEKRVLEKSMKELNDENTHLREQLTNFRRLLANAEDEKDNSINNLTLIQSELETEKQTRRLKSELEHRQQKKSLEDLKSEVNCLREELDSEKRRRHRLESLYNKRDDQVSQLRSTFDQSLNTINNDTKNIKNILGKSLQKLDRQIMNQYDSDVTENEMDVTNSTEKFDMSTDKYLSLPRKYRTLSLESSIDTLALDVKSKPNSTANTPQRSYRSPVSTSSVLLPSKIPSNSFKQESNTRRTNKRLTR